MTCLSLALRLIWFDLGIDTTGVFVLECARRSFSLVKNNDTRFCRPFHADRFLVSSGHECVRGGVPLSQGRLWLAHTFQSNAIAITAIGIRSTVTTVFDAVQTKNRLVVVGGVALLASRAPAAGITTRTVTSAPPTVVETLQS